MDISPIGEGRLILCLRSEIGILDLLQSLLVSGVSKISESHYSLIKDLYFICKRRVLSRASRLLERGEKLYNSFVRLTGGLRTPKLLSLT